MVFYEAATGEEVEVGEEEEVEEGRRRRPVIAATGANFR
jgi:hypothetical protein